MSSSDYEDYTDYDDYTLSLLLVLLMSDHCCYSSSCYHHRLTINVITTY